MPRAGARIETGDRFPTVDGFTHGFNPRPDFADQTDQPMETFRGLLGSSGKQNIYKTGLIVEEGL